MPASDRPYSWTKGAPKRCRKRDAVSACKCAPPEIASRSAGSVWVVESDVSVWKTYGTPAMTVARSRSARSRSVAGARWSMSRQDAPAVEAGHKETGGEAVVDRRSAEHGVARGQTQRSGDVAGLFCEVGFGAQDALRGAGRTGGEVDQGGVVVTSAQVACAWIGVVRSRLSAPVPVTGWPLVMTSRTPKRETSGLQLRGASAVAD